MTKLWAKQKHMFKKKHTASPLKPNIFSIQIFSPLRTTTKLNNHSKQRGIPNPQTSIHTKIHTKVHNKFYTFAFLFSFRFPSSSSPLLLLSSSSSSPLILPFFFSSLFLSSPPHRFGPIILDKMRYFAFQ